MYDTNRAREGTLADVLAEFGPGIRQMTLAYAWSPADREDLYQEIAIALWRALPTFRGEASMGTFVFRIARNRAISFRTRSRRRSSRELLMSSQDSVLAAHGTEARFSCAVETEQESRRVRAAVARLPAGLRQTILLRLDGLSDREIGSRLGITENATAVRLFRARRRLRKLMDPGVAT